MLLTVHDELVFEVSKERVEEAADLVKREMEAAYELDVPLRADIGWGAELGRGRARRALNRTAALTLFPLVTYHP